jgi:hypothetical protein
VTPGQREESLPTSQGRCVLVRLVVGDTIAVPTGVLSFSAKLRNETDLDALSDDLVGVVRDDAASPPLFAVAPRRTHEGN